MFKMESGVSSLYRERLVGGVSFGKPLGKPRQAFLGKFIKTI